MECYLKKIVLKWKLSLIIPILYFLLIPSVYADDVGRGGFAGSFLRMGLGARALGMGGCGAAIPVDGYTTYYNPAGLVYLNGHEVTATLTSMALDRRLYYVGYAQSFDPRGKGMMRGGFSAGWLSAGVVNIDARDFSGNDIGTLSSHEHCFYFGFALNPFPFISVGLNSKLVYQRFPEITDQNEAVSGVGFGFDVGIMVKPLNRLTIGLTVQDLRTKYTWDTQKLFERGSQTVNPFLKVLRAGASYDSLFQRVTLAFDLVKVEYLPWEYRAGLQVELIQALVFRGGLRHGQLTFGGGYRFTVKFVDIQLDYAYVSDPVAPRSNHIFSWIFSF
jgi:hypothetical protein